MYNLPDSLYVDYADGSSSSSNAAPPNNAGSATSALSPTERSKIGWLIPLVNLPHTRSEAITQLNNIFQKNKIALMMIRSDARFGFFFCCVCVTVVMSQVQQYDYLQLTGLGVIEALVKETGPDTPDIVHYLLQVETVPGKKSWLKNTKRRGEDKPPSSPED
nr:hypothetical protein [Tanacetum cinerariifolium]